MTTPASTPDDAVIVHSGDAQRLGHPAAVRVGLLADASATSGAVSVVRVTLAEGMDGAKPHHHAHSAELFYLLGGRAQLLVGDRVLEAGEGDLLVVPRHLPHAFGAVPGQTADLLVVITPGIDRFEYFKILERVALGRVPADTLLREQERFDTWFLDSAVWDHARSRRDR
jgi:quercetin dioxygenase-like cupin family protein